MPGSPSVGRTDREPERTCVACRRRRPRGSLIRIVRGPGGEACFDHDARLPGRGAWVCAEPGCVAGLAPAPLARALRGPVTLAAPAERRDAIAGALGRRVASLLLVARKARAAVFGAAGVGAALGAGRAGLVLLDGEAPADAPETWRGRAGEVPVLALPPQARLGELAGRGPTKVGAIAPGGLADATERALRLWREFSPQTCHNGGS